MTLAVRRLAIVLLLLGAACLRQEQAKFGGPFGADPALPAPVLDSADGQSLVEVELHGLIAHVTSDGKRRAVLVRDAMHDPILSTPLVYAGSLASVFPAGAITKDIPRGECHVSISGFALRVIGLDGSSPGGFQRKAPLDGTDYTNPLPRLSTMGTLGNDAIKKLQSDVTSDSPSATGPVASWFEMNGGQVNFVNFTCSRAKLPTDADYHGFNRLIIVSMFTIHRAQLQVRPFASSTWRTIPLDTAHLTLRITNEPNTAAELKKPHFDRYGLLADPQNNNFPNVIIERPDQCATGVGTVPGCSNSQFP